MERLVAVLGLEARHEEGRRDARLARAARAADAVHVGVEVVLGQVELDDVRDVVDVEAARGDVRGHEDVAAPLLEALQRRLPLGLGPVAVDVLRAEFGLGQLALDPRRDVLLLDEDDGLLARRQHGQQQLELRPLVRRGRVDQALLDGRDGRAHAADGDLGDARPVEVRARDLLHRRREGRAEHQGLALPRRRELGDDLAQLGLEAHVEHAVRLVEDGEPDALERHEGPAVARPLEEVDEAARRRHEDLDAPGQARQLAPRVRAAVAADAPVLARLRRVERELHGLVGDLRRELARRG